MRLRVASAWGRRGRGCGTPFRLAGLSASARHIRRPPDRRYEDGLAVRAGGDRPDFDACAYRTLIVLLQKWPNMLK